MRFVATGLLILGGALVVLSLMAIGVLLSGMEIDPVRQGGTGYFDFVLFFNGVLCLLPITALSLVLGLRLRRGDHWAWFAALILCGLIATVVPFAVFLLSAPAPYAIVPATFAVTCVALLLAPGTRTYFSGSAR